MDWQAHERSEFRDELLRNVDRRLSGEYGRPIWHSHGDPLDELVSTVLSQHTSDINTARAFSSLKCRFKTWQEVIHAPTTEVANAIRAGGLANIKAPRIQLILNAILTTTGELSLEVLRDLPLDEARSWLQSLPGVGPKTAACVLLFSLGRPTMPVDTHVHRVSKRLGLIDEKMNAEAAHEVLDAMIGPDHEAIYAIHMNVIKHGRTTCKAQKPRCSACVLADLCPSARL